jgi:hypothetical protein
MQTEEIEERLELVTRLTAAEKALDDSSVGAMSNDDIEARLELVTRLIAAEKELAEVG